jgi:phytoene dehydrogenase-like protein
MPTNVPKACVIGSGPNGLAAAIVLAQSGLEVEVFEAEAVPGGAARTLELTLPGFRHDFGSAVHPLAAGSPFFSSLPLNNFGLEWIHSPAPLAHPFDDGTAVVLERDLNDAERGLGEDGLRWVALMRPFVEHWNELAGDVLRPPTRFPRHPFLMAHFGLHVTSSARDVSRRFRSERTRALFAGLAAHSFVALDEILSGVFGLLMAIPAHVVGWPIARGGSQALTDALSRYLASLGGALKTSARVERLKDLPAYDLILCDVTPRQLLSMAPEELGTAYKQKLKEFPYGPGAFKVDYALSAPVPWRAAACRRTATVHLGGTFEEIARSEKAMRRGEHAQQPFVLFVQPSLWDSSRAPGGKHTAWAYCHVPNGSKLDMLPRVEAQIERFAPGFGECVLARRVLSPADLESMDSNLVGGDIQGGVLDISHFLFRPTRKHYATSNPKIYLCSASTPPGGGVHGMCGYHAANTALRRVGWNRESDARSSARRPWVGN